MSKYTWIVTRDLVLGDSSDAIGCIGPPDETGHANFVQVINHGVQFRMMDAEGDVQFSGYIAGEYEGSEPLEEYGRQNGCQSIQYEWNGEWLALATFRRFRDLNVRS